MPAKGLVFVFDYPFHQGWDFNQIRIAWYLGFRVI